MGIQRIEEAAIKGLKVVASSPSGDVIPANKGKLELLRALQRFAPKARFLYVGDRPCWLGNDSQLLAQEFSLSVDEVDGCPDLSGILLPPESSALRRSDTI